MSAALPSVLREILAGKVEEVAAGRSQRSEADLLAECAQLPPCRGFEAALEAAARSGPAIIAEIKKASPSAGVIRPDFHPGEIARAYAAAGAACLSVLTDRNWFQGCPEFLVEAREACSLPVLRKDFMLDPWQVLEARAMGADCILLIVAALADEQMRELHEAATRMGLDVLIEVHDRAELERALALPGGLIGVNNRNLHTFTTRLTTSLELAHYMPAGRPLVTESGIRTVADVESMLAAGIRHFLVGEAFMRAANPGQALHELFFSTPDPEGVR